MEGTTLTRILRLLCQSIRQPQYIAPQLFSLPALGKSPLDMGLPWISFSAISFLEKHINNDTRVFEWGSGGSTLFFAKRCKSVTSCESHPDWFEKVTAVLEQQQINNVEVLLKEMDPHSETAFRESSYCKAIANAQYDVILVDGYELSVPTRPICFALAEEHISPGGIIVVDDSWRYPTLRESNKASRHRIFKSVGPCRYGVTTTDLFFY